MTLWVCNRNSFLDFREGSPSPYQGKYILAVREPLDGSRVARGMMTLTKKNARGMMTLAKKTARGMVTLAKKTARGMVTLAKKTVRGMITLTKKNRETHHHSHEKM